MDAKTVPLWLVLVDAICLSGSANHFGRQACAGSSARRLQFSRGPVQRSGIDWAIRTKAGVALAAPRFLPLSEERVVRGCPRLAWTSGRCRRRCCICSVMEARQALHLCSVLDRPDNCARSQCSLDDGDSFRGTLSVSAFGGFLVAGIWDPLLVLAQDRRVDARAALGIGSCLGHRRVPGPPRNPRPESRLEKRPTSHPAN